MSSVDINGNSLIFYNTHANHFASIPVSMEHLVAVTVKSEWMVKAIYDWSLGEDAYTATNCTPVKCNKIINSYFQCV